MFNYTYQMFEKDIPKLIENLSKSKNVHLVAPMHGAFPITTKLRNLMNYKVSIVKMSTYFGNDKKADMIFSDDIREDETLVIIEDCFDSYFTVKEVMDLLRKSYPNNEIRALSLFGRKETNLMYCEYLNEYPLEWISFPWE